MPIHSKQSASQFTAFVSVFRMFVQIFMICILLLLGYNFGYDPDFIDYRWVAYTLFGITIILGYFLILWIWCRVVGRPRVSMGPNGLFYDGVGFKGKTIPWTMVKAVVKQRQRLFSFVTPNTSVIMSIILSPFNIYYTTYVVTLTDEVKSLSLGFWVREVEISPLWLTASKEETVAALSRWTHFCELG